MSSQAYLMSKQAADNWGKSFQRVREENTLENILSEAMNSNDPKQIQDTIGKILSQVSPERQNLAIQFLQGKFKDIQAQKTEAAQRESAKEGGYTYGAPLAVQTQQVKNQQPAKALGGITGQPIPQNISQEISNVLNENKEANADELAIAMGNRGIPQAYSNSYIENRRRQDEAKAKRSQPGDEFSKGREKAVLDYTNESLQNRENTKDMAFTIATARKAINGEISGPGFEAAIKSNPYLSIIYGKTTDESLLDAANKKLLEGTKNIFGSKPTEREIFLLLTSMLPSIGKTREANLAGLDFIEKTNNIKLLKENIVDELTNGGTKYIADLEKQVDEKLKPYKDQLHKELKEAVNIYRNGTKTNSNNNKIKVMAPDGKTTGFMTQKQIDEAAKKNAIFTPI
jgi:hypothetical protein